MNTVYIRGLRAEAVIGIHPWEREIRQALVLDLDMASDTPRAAATEAPAPRPTSRLLRRVYHIEERKIHLRRGIVLHTCQVDRDIFLKLDKTLMGGRISEFRKATLEQGQGVSQFYCSS